MFNETERVLIEILSGIPPFELWKLGLSSIVALAGGGGIIWYFKDEILSFMKQIRYPGKEFLYKKAPCGCKSVVAWAKHRMIPIR